MPPTVNSDQKYCLYKSFEVSKVKKLPLKKKKKEMDLRNKINPSQDEFDFELDRDRSCSKN